MITVVNEGRPEIQQLMSQSKTASADQINSTLNRHEEVVQRMQLLHSPHSYETVRVDQNCYQEHWYLKTKAFAPKNFGDHLLSIRAIPG